MFVPLRPIVSYTNSPTNNLSKFPSRILSSLLVNCYSVRNSKEFVDYVQKFTISENEILVSFDVVSLLWSRLDHLSSNESFASRTSLDIPDITISPEHNKTMALLWALASLLSFFLFTWNASTTQLSHFTSRSHFG